MQKLLINHALIVINIILIFICGTAFSTDRYVSPPGGYGTNDTTGGYTNWLGAATNIQWAVNKAVENETVWVTNGTYLLTNEISITSPITVRGVNGRNVTIVNGNYLAYTNRCFRIAARAVIDGFTIINGFAVTNSPEGANGGGVYMGIGSWTEVTGTIQNCTISGNIVSNPADKAYGGGVSIYGKGYIYNCIICSNLVNGAGGSGSAGGGVYLYGGNGGGGIVSNCVIFTNTVYRSAGEVNQFGGGIYNGKGTVVNCTVYSNFTQGRGGGIYCSGGYLKNSSIYKNCNNNDDGGGMMGVGSTTENCLVYGNIGGNNRFDTASVIRNCTFVFNSSAGISTYSTTVPANFENIISYYNRSADSISGGVAPFFTNCCANNSGTIMTNGSGNITNAPLFVNTNISNYRLVNNSPCINAGTNRSWMANAFDLDGRARIRYGIVDIGAYERIHEATFYRFH